MTTPPTTSPRVKNGAFTITAPDGRHFSLKLYTRQFGDEWKRVVALKVGHSFTGVAFWNDAEGFGYVWKKHRAHLSRGRFDGYSWPRGGSGVERKLATWSDLALRGDDGHWANEGYTVVCVAFCVRCNRELTDPESIRLGLGPTCRGEMMKETIVRMAQGNPGAITVLMQLAQAGRGDVIIALDALEIHGPRIWLAWKDCGDCTVETMVAHFDNDASTLVLRSSLKQLGY